MSNLNQSKQTNLKQFETITNDVKTMLKNKNTQKQNNTILKQLRTHENN